MTRLLGVKAESTDFVALASEMVVDGYRLARRSHSRISMCIKEYNCNDTNADRNKEIVHACRFDMYGIVLQFR